MTGKKQLFRPLTPGKVSIFVCGPTVQSLIHVGHARTSVFYDVVARYLTHLGYEVNYLMNITDIDERITQASAESSQDPEALARSYTNSFLEDMKSLGNTAVTRFESVSSFVQTMIQEVATLISRRRAYVVDGFVYFDTSTFPAYGRLSHQAREDLALRPLELSPKKRNLADFSLWRPDVLVKGKWNSPWGLGSPGWHIQDTAVTMSILGPQYDIHGGAYELVYPHHEAEIAQAESLTGIKPVVKYWIHTHHVNMKGRKMSKSLGNVLTVREALRDYSAAELRLFLLSTHYRKDMDLTDMNAAASRLRRMRRAAGEIADAVRFDAEKAGDLAALAQFETSMNDDFDTPHAISWVERRLWEAGKEHDLGKKEARLSAAVAAMGILGVDLLGTS